MGGGLVGWKVSWLVSGWWIGRLEVSWLVSGWWIGRLESRLES